MVVGHICLDVIPQLQADPGGRARRPGALDLIGPVTLAAGGCVGNTGIALHRLGLRTTLVARVGDDEFGGLLSSLVGHAAPEASVRLIPTRGRPTSYSLVANRPGRDRSIEHFPGVNGAFVADDVPAELLASTTLLHVGYPPLMAGLIADDGRELALLLARAHQLGVITSLDMANANLDSGADRLRWRRLLERVLPDVDVFLPSLAEAGHLLRRRVHADAGRGPSLASVARLADELVAMGAGITGVKLGEHGLYVRTALPDRLKAGGLRLSPTWAERELYSTVFETDVIGTAGAGDTTIAGFLFGLLAGMSPEAAITAACAVGGSSTEAADGTSGVPGWPAIDARIRRGWHRRSAAPGAGWRESPDGGFWFGARDRGPTMTP